MYIRVKRQKTTVFLQVEPTDTVLEVKQNLQALIEKVRLHTTLSNSDERVCSFVFSAAVSQQFEQRWTIPHRTASCCRSRVCSGVDFSTALLLGAAKFSSKTRYMLN